MKRHFKLLDGKDHWFLFLTVMMAAWLLSDGGTWYQNIVLEKRNWDKTFFFFFFPGIYLSYFKKKSLGIILFMQNICLINNESITIFQLCYFHWIKRMDLVGMKTVYLWHTPFHPFVPRLVIPFYKLHNTCMYNVNKLNAFIEQYTHKF